MPDATLPMRPARAGDAAVAIIIRASSLSMFPDCMRRTAARVFRDTIGAAGFSLREPTAGIGAATGTATHAAATYTLTAKQRRGDLGDTTEAQDRALAALDETIAAGVAWDDTSPNRNTAQQQVIRQVTVYRAQVAPRIIPLAVEERLEAELTPGVVVSGQVDTAIHRGIRDLKTGIRRRANGYQYGLYALLQRSHGRRVDTLIEDYIPRVRIGAAQPPAQIHRYDVGDAERAATAIINRMIGDLRAFEATGEPWSFLANPNSMLCSERWCPAWGTAFCRAHLGD